MHESSWATNVFSVYIYVIFFSAPIGYHLLVLNGILARKHDWDTIFAEQMLDFFFALEGFQGKV